METTKEHILAFIFSLVLFAIVFYGWYFIGSIVENWSYNSPELRQCLSQSGTTWQWGECVIILNK